MEAKGLGYDTSPSYEVATPTGFVPTFTTATILLFGRLCQPLGGFFRTDQPRYDSSALLLHTKKNVVRTINTATIVRTKGKRHVGTDTQIIYSPKVVWALVGEFTGAAGATARAMPGVPLSLYGGHSTAGGNTRARGKPVTVARSHGTCRGPFPTDPPRS